MFERSSSTFGVDRMTQPSVVRAPLRSESPAMLTTPYRSPYRQMQPTGFFRSTSTFTEGTADLKLGGAMSEGQPPRHRSPLPRAEPGTPPRSSSLVPVHPAEFTTPARMPSQSSGAGSNSAPYVSPYRSLASSQATSPRAHGKNMGGGVGLYTSLNVSSRSYNDAAWGQSQPVASPESAAAISERLQRQTYATTREEDRRKKRAEEQRKRTEELEQTLFGTGIHNTMGKTRNTSLRSGNADSRVQSGTQQRHPALLWGATRVPDQRSMHSVAAVAGARSPRERAADEQQMSLQQRLNPAGMSAPNKATTVAHQQPQMEPEPEPEPQPQPQPQRESVSEPELKQPQTRPNLELGPLVQVLSSSALAGTPPGPPPGHARNDEIDTADSSSPLTLNAFTLVREQSEGNMTPPGPPPVQLSTSPPNPPAGEPKAHDKADRDADEDEVLEQRRKKQRAMRRAALGALLAGL